jgi:ADP-heptose:LPS heptosyltransferase
MKILVVILGRIGDMILSTPMFSAIKAKYPDSELTVLASSINHVVIKNNPNVDSIKILNKSPLKLLKLILELRRVKYDWLIDPKDHYSNESNILAGLLRSNNKVGLINSENSYFEIGIPDENMNLGLHMTARAIQSLNCLSIEQSNHLPKPELFIDKLATERLNKILPLHQNKKLILINVSAGSQDRKWNKENWISVIKSMDNDESLIIVIYMKEDESDAIEITNQTDAIRLTSSDFSEIIALVSMSNLVITPDTSIVHVASAFNVPLIGLYGNIKSNNMKFAPLSDLKLVITSENEGPSIHSIEVNDLIKAISNWKSLIENP